MERFMKKTASIPVAVIMLLMACVPAAGAVELPEAVLGSLHGPTLRK